MPTIQYLLLASAVINIALAVLVLLHTRTHRAGRSFAWYLLSIAAWIISVSTIQPHYSDQVISNAIHTTFFFTTLMLVSWVWFCVDFPRAADRAHRVAAWVITVSCLPWLYIAYTDLIISDIIRKPGWVDAVFGPLFVPFYSWLLVIVTLTLVYLYRKGLSVTNLERLQLRYILLGSVGLVLAGCTLTMLIPLLTGSSRYALFGPLSSLFVTVSTTYAIVRYRLMDIRLVVRTLLSYIFTIGLLSLLYAFMLPLIEGFTALVDLHLPFRLIGFIMAFILALLFEPVLLQMHELLDRFLCADRLDYRNALWDACRLLSPGHNYDSIAEELRESLEALYQPHGIAIYIPGYHNQLTRITLTGVWAAAPATLLAADPVLAHAVATDEVLLAEELVRQPAPAHALGAHLKAWGADVAVPLLAGAQVCGFVLLGEKLSGDVYTADDIGLLRILGKQAAIALINARHYDEMVLLNEYHERLLHSMQDGVLAVDPAGRIVTFNPAAEAITGVTAPAALGRTLAAIGLPDVPLTVHESTTLETTLAAQDGRALPVLVTVTPFLRRWEIAPSHLVVFRDLSELRALEREKLQAERFSSMGAMAASLAHEIKNPLVPIQTFAHLLPHKYDDVEFRQEFSQTVVKEVERITRLVGQLLDLVRKPAEGRGQVALPAVLAELEGVLAPECRRQGVQLTVTVAPGLPPVHGVAGQLYQALLNVLTNAVQAVSAGGAVRVQLWAEGTSVCCRVQDSGPGVPPEQLGRIFEPLYTTKPGGHGLGLALTYQFVRAHGGDVRAECPPEGGLAITLTLPVDNTEKSSVCLPLDCLRHAEG